MKNNHRITGFLSAFLLTFIMFAVLFVLAVSFIGTGAGPNPWLQQVIRIKAHIASETPSPRILLCSGSSGLFGIDSERISMLTGLPVVNLATHAGITFRIYADEIIKHARSGDIIVLPLEIGHHYTETSDKIFSDLGVSMYFGGSFGYMRHLSMPEIYSLYLHYGPDWLGGIFSGKYRPYWKTDAGLIKSWHKARAKKKYRSGYHIASLNEYGDMLVDFPVQFEPYQIDRWSIPDHIGKEFLDIFGHIQQVAAERGCKVILTYSPLYWYPAYDDFCGPREILGKYGIVLSGRPEAFHFPHYCYLDTVYHLNRKGALFFSTELGQVICHEAGLEFSLPADWHHRSFADDWQRYFPQLHDAVVYSSGVMTADREIILSIDVPEEFAGESLYINLLLQYSGAEEEIFRSIKAAGTELQCNMIKFSSKAELELVLPAELNHGKKVEIIFERNSTGNGGFERMHFDLLHECIPPAADK